MNAVIGCCFRFGYIVFENEESLEKVMKEKQESLMDGEKIFLDYTNEKSKHGGRGGNKDFGRLFLLCYVLIQLRNFGIHFLFHAHLKLRLCTSAIWIGLYLC